MQIIELVDGGLYQWDTGRKIKITPPENTTIDEVQFANSKSANAITVTPLVEDGVMYAKIPNILLQESKEITVYVVMFTSDGERTVTHRRFYPTFRPKPEDYENAEEEYGNTYILEDEAGNRVVAVMVEEETVLTATANDIRIGTTAATEEGVTEGTKVIPSYHTNEGYRFITSGSRFETGAFEEYDFTRLQVIICPFNGSIVESVAAEKVAINEGVYAVNSTELIATVTRDDENHKISLGIINETENMYLLRYFTYKEIY